jgi:mannose-1-phosphate guanylyltransferase/mannose-6-phosphate isomerase
MTQLIHPVLLCGGSGTRLWPLSRKSYPKQFVKLTGAESLYQASARRLSGTGFAAPTIVTASDFRFIVIEQLAALEIAPADILIEPSAKNTAAAICAAALALDARAPGALMLAAPSDHAIPDAVRFRDAVQAAAPAAAAGQLVTFGIRPDRAETGYGWLELSTPTPDFAPLPQPLRSFVEKPDLAKAETLLAGGMHLWNAGIVLDYPIISMSCAVKAPLSSSKCHITPGKPYLHLFKFERYVGGKVLMRVRDDIP